MPEKRDVSKPSAKDWSFSAEWDQHFDAALVRTWGWSIEERLEQFLLEVGVEPEWCAGKRILDAGCGNGQLTEALTTLGANVVGIDYSTSVFRAGRARKAEKVSFLQGDLQSPPFARESFDIVISNGVIHHTRSTRHTFEQVVPLLKAGGKFYLWLYRRPGGLRRTLAYPVIDTMRFVVSRLPRIPQTAVVKAYTLALLAVHTITGRRGNLSWDERVVDAFDTLTPLYRHYHTPMEVASWFFNNGFSAPTLTHWDNSYGFGVVATKVPQGDTPGMNFGRSDPPRRYWK
jgi:SAM-dependent methyltransferase